MTAGWCCRVVRAAVFAAVCALLAALGHGTVSGSAVPWWAVAAAAVTVGGATWCLAGRERGLLLVVSVAMATQAVLHTWYSLAQAIAQRHEPYLARPTTRHPAGAHGTPLEHVAHLDHMGSDMAGVSSFGMFAAHVLVVLLCSLWLGYGERAVFRVLRTLAGWFVAPLRLPLLLPAPPHRPGVRPQRDRSARAPRRFLLVHTITSRGPPTGTAVT
ncbi:hypothetical protein ABZ918_04205 [Streptomyces viridosporus]|uniref:hypothetical protein n=1 Tax=Streptomyces viridosporus TaxID=67581 RepID=UPI0034387EEE